MPHCSKIPTGPEVTVIVHAGRTAWLHRRRKRKILSRKQGWPSPWRAKIERYNGDIIYLDGNLSLGTARQQVERFLESLQMREELWGNHYWARFRRRTQLT